MTVLLTTDHSVEDSIRFLFGAGMTLSGMHSSNRLKVNVVNLNLKKLWIVSHPG